MPTIAATGFVGAGTPKDPFMPDVDLTGITDWAVVDLRADATQAAGRCIIVINESVTLTSTTGGTLRQTTSLDRLTQAATRLLAAQMDVMNANALPARSVGELVRLRLGDALQVTEGRRRIVVLGHVLLDEAG